MTRPWRSRIWFYKPYVAFIAERGEDKSMWIKPTVKERLKRLVPLSTGGDEFNWHTVVVGYHWTGQIIFATKPCDGTGKCKEAWDDPDFAPHVKPTEWPIDAYGHNHVRCDNPDCHCKYEETA